MTTMSTGLNFFIIPSLFLGGTRHTGSAGSYIKRQAHILTVHELAQAKIFPRPVFYGLNRRGAAVGFDVARYADLLPLLLASGGNGQLRKIRSHLPSLFKSDSFCQCEDYREERYGNGDTHQYNRAVASVHLPSLFWSGSGALAFREALRYT